MRLSRNEFRNSLCKCLIVLSSCLITRKGRARKSLLPALEEFLPTEAPRVRERQNPSRNAREWSWSFSRSWGCELARPNAAESSNLSRLGATGAPDVRALERVAYRTPFLLPPSPSPRHLRRLPAGVYEADGARWIGRFQNMPRHHSEVCRSARVCFL